MRNAVLAAVAALFLITPALAEENGMAMPPAGHTIINLSVTEQTKLPQDTLTATLRYELDGGSANEIQDRINKAVAQAVATSKEYASVQTATGSYYVYGYDQSQVVDPRTGQPVSTQKKWRGSQSLTLESKESTKLLELAGKIQTMGFVMEGMSYSLSREKSESVQDDLMKKALTSLGAKAKVAATALGKSGYDILSIDVNGSSPTPMPVFAKAMMANAQMDSAREVAAPSAAAGESDVALTITAKVLIKP